jgi:hypothetical protein
MIGKGRSDVKHELSSVFLAIRADVSIICLTFFFFHTNLRTTTQKRRQKGAAPVPP